MSRQNDRLILASGSSARRAVLDGAGVPFTARPSSVDEAALKPTLAHLSPADLALALAEAKALDVSRAEPDAWVLGADQTLELEGGSMDKAEDLAEGRARLAAMAGRTHSLHAGLALAKGGQVIWTHLGRADLTMRPLSDAFLDAYMADEGPQALSSVGVYRLEGPGAQLFERVEGDYFTILGLPLWPLLAELRRIGIIGT
nr:Maf family protein [Brevundimonas sp. Leaf363]